MIETELNNNFKELSIKYTSSLLHFENENNLKSPKESVIDNLLFEIYDKWAYKCRHDSSWESDAITSASEAASSGLTWRRSIGEGISRNNSEGEQKQFPSLSESMLNQKCIEELKKIRTNLKQSVVVLSAKLVRQLKRRDHALVKMQNNCDILTAILQASSLKRREDTKLKFVMEPKPGNEAFRQWCEAMKGVARLPLGLPAEIRKKVWLSLANNHITVQKYDWNRVIKFAFNERSNPDDDSLGMQIVKDLHRTGCDTFATESERAILKRVLLAYARWNKRVGYCQGFNVLAAIILEVMERNEEDSLKIMVYLVDHILPESYFAQNLQALSIDMAVFRELLNIHLPKLAAHLNNLQQMSQEQNASYTNTNHYEPPLTNVFTMQWFLTLFATCLPPDLVLHIWDSIMLEGSEIIFRTGLAIWELLSDRLLKVTDADSFYCTMRDLTGQLSEGVIAQPDQLINRIYNMTPLPFPGLSNLRDEFTYNINPFSTIPSAVISYGTTGNDTGEDEADEDEDYKLKNNNKTSIGCFDGIRPSNHMSNFKSKENQMPLSLSSVDISQVGPGAVSTSPSIQHNVSPGATKERMCTNLTTLENHYNKIKDKQRKTNLLMNNISHEKVPSKSLVVSPTRTSQLRNHSKSIDPTVSHIIVKSTYPSLQNSMVNHLFLSRESAENVQQRPILMRQNCLRSITSDSTSTSSIKPMNFDISRTHKHFFNFDSINGPESSISSIRPASDTSSANKPRRSLSQSDIATSYNETVTSTARSASLADLQINQVTLLELSKTAQFKGSKKTDLESFDVSPRSVNPLTTPDLNFALERHHERIQNERQHSKVGKCKDSPIKLLQADDVSSQTEIGHTARWVAEHHLQSSYVLCASSDFHPIARHSSVSLTSNKTFSKALFGTKLGLYKTMAQTCLYRSKMNGVLQSAYLNELQTCGKFAQAPESMTSKTGNRLLFIYEFRNGLRRFRCFQKTRLLFKRYTYKLISQREKFVESNASPHILPKTSIRSTDTIDQIQHVFPQQHEHSENYEFYKTQVSDSKKAPKRYRNRFLWKLPNALKCRSKSMEIPDTYSSSDLSIHDYKCSLTPKTRSINANSPVIRKVKMSGKDSNSKPSKQADLTSKHSNASAYVKTNERKISSNSYDGTQTKKGNIFKNIQIIGKQRQKSETLNVASVGNQKPPRKSVDSQSQNRCVECPPMKSSKYNESGNPQLFPIIQKKELRGNQCNHNDITSNIIEKVKRQSKTSTAGTEKIGKDKSFESIYRKRSNSGPHYDRKQVKLPDPTSLPEYEPMSSITFCRTPLKRTHDDQYWVNGTTNAETGYFKKLSKTSISKSEQNLAFSETSKRIEEALSKSRPTLDLGNETIEAAYRFGVNRVTENNQLVILSKSSTRDASTFLAEGLHTLSEAESFYAFFQHSTCYDMMPNNSKLVVLDSRLQVGKAFRALIFNGVRAALIWQAKVQKYVGILTITDFIKVLTLYLEKTPDVSEIDIETQTIDKWREITGTINKPLVFVSPESSLFTALKELQNLKVHRLPVIDFRSGNALHIITHKRLLKYLYIKKSKIPNDELLKCTIEEANVGTFKDVHTATLDTSIKDVLNIFETKHVSAVPVLDPKTKKLLDIYAKFDCIHLASTGNYKDLNLTISQGLAFRVKSTFSVQTCLKTDTVDFVMEKIVLSEVHRLVVINNETERLVRGIVSLADLLHYFVLRYNGRHSTGNIVSGISCCTNLNLSLNISEHESHRHNSSPSSLNINCEDCFSNETNCIKVATVL